MKNKWLGFLIEFLNVLRTLILTIVVLLGFWMLYCLIWFTLGLPQSEWSLLGMFAFAFLSEILFLIWLFYDKTKS